MKWSHAFHCELSLFCQYLLPIADILPGRCRCQEEVYTRGGSCPGWPYLEQRDKDHNTVPTKAEPRKTNSLLQRLAKKASNPFCTCKTTSQYERADVQSISRDGYYLCLFWLIKNWGNFWEPEQETRLQHQIGEAGWFFPPSNDDSPVVFQLT